MRFFPFFLLLTGCAAQSAGVSAKRAEEPTKIVAVGTVDLVPLGNSKAEDVIVGDRRVMGFTILQDRNLVSIYPLKIGTSSVVIQGRNGQPTRKLVYNAVRGELARQLSEVTQLLEGIPGVGVSELGGAIRISGELTDPKTVQRDFERIHEAAYLYTCFNNVTLADSLYEKSATLMQDEIDKLEGASGVRVRVLNGTFLLEGSAPSQEVREVAEVMVNTLLPPIMASTAIQDSALILGAKKYAVRNLIRVNDRSPASACPKN